MVANALQTREPIPRDGKDNAIDNDWPIKVSGAPGLGQSSILHSALLLM